MTSVLFTYLLGIDHVIRESTLFLHWRSGTLIHLLPFLRMRASESTFDLTLGLVQWRQASTIRL